MDIIFKLLLLVPVIISSYFLFINIGILSIFPIWLLCGLIDVSRHKTMDLKLIKEYFLGKGFLTFILSPLNLFADLLSFRNLHTFKIEDLPIGHQDEINAVVSLLMRKILWLKATRNSYTAIGKYLIYHRTTIKRMYDTILDKLTNKVICNSIDIINKKFS